VTLAVGGWSGKKTKRAANAATPTVFETIEGKAIDGLLDAFGGSLSAVEHVLRCGTGAALGGFQGRALSGATLRLAQDVVLDVYVFGTGARSVREFDSFMAYRTAKAFAYELDQDPERGVDEEGGHAE